jgi:hypothetical protein
LCLLVKPDRRSVVRQSFELEEPLD